MKKRRVWIISAVALLLATGSGYVAYTRGSALAAEPEEPALQTATVYRGDIVLTADGSGELMPAAELELAFQTGGVLTEVAVEVGDQVKTGDQLAKLDDTDASQAVTEAEMQVTQAEINLVVAQNETEAGLSQADLEAAEADYREAASLLAHSGDQIASARVSLERAISDLASAQESYDEAWDPARDWELYMRGSALESERESAASALANAQYDLEVAQADYNLAAIGIDESAVQDAEIAVINAQVALANEPVELDQLELDLAQAQLDLEAAQRALEETNLIAPIDGTVLDVAAEVGESVGTDSLITLADLETPQVVFWVEESDMSSVAVGSPVNIVFEALPEITFTGEIVRVDPALVTVDSTLAVQAWASVDLSAQPVGLLSGMTAEVEVVAGEARGALLVPVGALRELSPGEYSVFVVNSNGELELRSVEVGLQDFVNAEILSGLEVGEVVSVGAEDDSAASDVVPEFSPPAGGMPFVQ
jgi:HlyD family secretion protein